MQTKTMWLPLALIAMAGMLGGCEQGGAFFNTLQRYGEGTGERGQQISTTVGRYNEREQDRWVNLVKTVDRYSDQERTESRVQVIEAARRYRTVEAEKWPNLQIAVDDARAYPEKRTVPDDDWQY